MSDFGHAIGVAGQPTPEQPSYQSPWPGQPSGPGPSYGQYEPQPPAEQDLDLGTAHAQARVRAESGDLTGARTMIEEVLAAGELRLGRDDPALVPLMVDLATLARRLGNLTEAGNQLHRAYGIVVTAHGPGHATSLSIEGRLAAVLYRLGEPTEAYDWHLADAGRRVLGDEHPAVRGAQQRLAAVAPPPAAPGPSPAYPPPPPPAAAPFAPAVPEPAPVPLPPLAPSPPVTIPYASATPTTYGTPPPAPPQSPPASPYGPAIEGDIWEGSPGELTVRTRRPNSGGVALVASLGAVILVGGIVIALQMLRPGGAPVAQDPVTQRSTITVTANPTPTAAPASPPPDGIRITDNGGSVTLNWADPSDGQVPFVISAARQGHAPTAVETVPAGQTTATLYGLNENFNYCFTVAAVWSADLIQESIRTCTHRLNVTATPT